MDIAKLASALIELATEQLQTEANGNATKNGRKNTMNGHKNTTMGVGNTTIRSETVATAGYTEPGVRRENTE